MSAMGNGKNIFMRWKMDHSFWCFEIVHVSSKFTYIASCNFSTQTAKKLCKLSRQNNFYYILYITHDVGNLEWIIAIAS